ncbi:MAG: MauE/DoxX family redox-associated membrane protein [Streptosporangiaceae bacterium]
MELLTAIREVQIPLLSAMLLGGGAAKLLRMARPGSADAGIGAATLFPTRLRRPLALAVCAAELSLGAGLIITAGSLGGRWPGICVRLATGVLFLVATCALIELRGSRSDAGCGCFGELSTAPVSGRTLSRAAMLAVAALGTITLPPLQLPHSHADAALMAGILAAELVVIGALSPELGEGLVRLGYSEPCELRVLSEYRTLSSLRRSAQWRRYAVVLTADRPVDSWRELCWRYLVFPSQVSGRPAEVVFAVYLKPRRPAVHAALVDATTGEVMPFTALPPPGALPGPAPAGQALPGVQQAAARPLVPAQASAAGRHRGGGAPPRELDPPGDIRSSAHL